MMNYFLFFVGWIIGWSGTEFVKGRLKQRRERAARQPLPAQMDELRARIEQTITFYAGIPDETRHPALRRVGFELALKEILRLVPVQHDDQQGGKPEAGR